MKTKSIPVYNLFSLNLENQNTIEKITLVSDEFDLEKELFAIKITSNEKDMKPSYNINDRVIFEKNNSFKDADNKDCILKIENRYIFKRVTLQNDYLILTCHDWNDKNNCHTYSKKEIDNIPIEIIGIVKQIRRNI